MAIIELKNREKVDYLIEKRKEKLIYLNDLLKTNDAKSKIIFNEVITLNKQLELEEDLMIINTLNLLK